MKPLLAATLLFLTVNAFSQNQYHIASASQFNIAGTSTLHDWTMETQQAEGSAYFTFEEGQLTHIKRLKVSVPTESLKSGKNAMDQNAYKALKSEEYPEIHFDITGVDRMEQEDGKISISCEGDLTIAGTTRQENIEVVCETDASGNLLCQGVKDLTMSAFGVKPPSFMMGAVKTGDAITIQFDIQFNINKNN